MESSQWDKRLRMSPFVQAGRMSFERAAAERIPERVDEHTVFHILLRNGMFSHARVVPDGYGGSIWVHPALYLSGGNWGVFGSNEVVAWKERN